MSDDRMEQSRTTDLVTPTEAERDEWRADATTDSGSSCCVLAGQEGHRRGEHRAYYDVRIERLLDALDQAEADYCDVCNTMVMYSMENKSLRETLARVVAVRDAWREPLLDGPKSRAAVGARHVWAKFDEALQPIRDGGSDD